MKPKWKNLGYTCQICGDEGWVCEYHPENAWKSGDGCCGGAGAPCECNTNRPAWDHDIEKDDVESLDLQGLD